MKRKILEELQGPGSNKRKMRTSGFWDYMKRTRLEEKEPSILVQVQFEACWVWSLGTSKKKCPMNSSNRSNWGIKELRRETGQPLLREHMIRLGKGHWKKRPGKLWYFILELGIRCKKHQQKGRRTCKTTQYPWASLLSDVTVATFFFGGQSICKGQKYTRQSIEEIGHFKKKKLLPVPNKVISDSWRWMNLNYRYAIKKWNWRG